MTTQRDPAAAMESQGKAEDAKARAQTAAQESQRANETLEAARSRLLEAQQRVESTDTALKNAVDAQVSAKGLLGESQMKLKLASKDTERTAQVKAKADSEAERANDRLIDQEARVAKAEAKGKEPNQAALDKAKSEAEATREKASDALLESDRARQTLEASQKEIENAETTLKNSDEELKQAREALATAKVELAQSEDNLKKATKEAESASKNQDKADRDAEKAVKKYEAALAKAEAKAAAERSVQRYTETPVVPPPQYVEPEKPPLSEAEPDETEAEASDESEKEPASAVKEAERVAETTMEKNREIASAPLQSSGELFGGIVTLFIARPAGRAQIKHFQESLGQFENLRVRSLGGSSGDGAQIVLSIEEPTPLLTRLNNLDSVAAVSKSGKGLEVTLKA